jgi:hypothetical protein
VADAAAGDNALYGVRSDGPAASSQACRVLQNELAPGRTRVAATNARPGAYHPDMAMTPAYALAHVFLPNLLKLKGHATVMSAIERRDLIFFDALWAQAHIKHNPYVSSQTREAFRIATITLPAPTEMGEAHMAGIVIKANDPCSCGTSRSSMTTCWPRRRTARSCASARSEALQAGRRTGADRQ